MAATVHRIGQLDRTGCPAVSLRPVSATHENTDLFDVGLFTDGPPHELLTEMRSDAPVRWNETADGARLLVDHPLRGHLGHQPGHRHVLLLRGRDLHASRPGHAARGEPQPPALQGPARPHEVPQDPSDGVRAQHRQRPRGPGAGAGHARDQRLHRSGQMRLREGPGRAGPARDARRADGHSRREPAADGALGRRDRGGPALEGAGRLHSDLRRDGGLPPRADRHPGRRRARTAWSPSCATPRSTARP